MPKIPTLIKLEDHFINQENIRAVIRHGTGTKITLLLGEDIIVNIDYDKVVSILPSEIRD